MGKLELLSVGRALDSVSVYETGTSFSDVSKHSYKARTNMPISYTYITRL